MFRVNDNNISLIRGDSGQFSITVTDMNGKEVALNDEDAVVTAADLRAIVAAVAVRSNLLHVAYRKAKEQVEAAVTADEVRDVTMN